MSQRVRRGDRRRRQRERWWQAMEAAGLFEPRTVHVDLVPRRDTGAAGSFGVTVVRSPCRHPGMATAPGLNICPSCGARVLVGVDLGGIDKTIVFADRMVHASGPQLVPRRLDDRERGIRTAHDVARANDATGFECRPHRTITRMDGSVRPHDWADAKTGGR